MLKKYLRISRPRFWLYLFGPFLIGAIAADTSDLFWPALTVFAFYFTFPANLLIYGVNDIFDYETDKNNPKKQEYEELVTPEIRWPLIKTILLWNVPFALVWFVDEMPVASKWALAGFLFFGIFYSAWPIRAKTKPLLDTLFNILYIFPALFAYGLLEYKFPPLMLIAAGTLWCMAMHAYSAIPDIASDKAANMRTIATMLGARGTLIFCTICYGAAAFLSYPWLTTYSLAAGALYIGMMAITFLRPDPQRVFGIYKYFPYINMFAGMALFFYIALIVK